MTAGQSNSNEALKLHFFYIVLILSIFIIQLITNDWTKVDGFTEYLNVASGVTSLVLGILAIIYSFVSTGSFNQTLGSIETSASRMGRVADELGGVLKSGESLQNRAEERTSELHGLIKDLRIGLDALAATTNDIAGSVEAMPDRINSLQKSATSYTAPDNPANGTTPLILDDAQLKAYFGRSSSFGVLGLYAAMRAAEKGKYVNFLKLLGPKNYEYVWGYLIASTAAGVIELEHSETINGMQGVRLKNPSESLSTLINEAWEKRAQSKNARKRKITEKYGTNIDDCLVDDAPPKENAV